MNRPEAIVLNTSLNNVLKKEWLFEDTDKKELKLKMEISETDLKEIFDFTNLDEMLYSVPAIANLKEDQLFDVVSQIILYKMFTDESQSQLDNVGYIARKEIFKYIFSEDKEVVDFFTSVGIETSRLVNGDIIQTSIENQDTE